MADKSKKKKGRCWKGYKPTPGKTPYSPGSCMKEGEEKNNPWAICGASVDQKKNKAKWERCVRKVKAKHKVRESLKNLIEKKGAAWTRKAGQNSKGGLNAKGRASYEKENPGSDLKPPVSSSQAKKSKKSAARRKSFCARMSGMRKRQKPSNNTGKDRLSLSLKKWDC